MMGRAVRLRRFFAACVTDAFQHDALVQNLKVRGDILGIRQTVEIPVVEIRDAAALNAMQVVMVRDVRIEPFGAAEDLDDVGNADMDERQQRSIDGVKRDVGIVSFDKPVKDVGRRVHVGLQQFPVDCHALGRNFQVMSVTCIDERLNFFGDVLSAHITTK